MMREAATRTPIEVVDAPDRPGEPAPAPSPAVAEGLPGAPPNEELDALEELRPDPHAGGERRLLLAAAAALGVVSLLLPLSASGIWDPYELEQAELARRIAVALLGAEHLAIEGLANTVPTIKELGRGELPFTSAALGFKLFGLEAWAGRLPLALWALVGALSTYALVARLADRAAAALSVVALVTMPLYFVHARTILGDIVTMAALAMATAGLGLATFDRSQGAVKRVGWLLLGLLGLAAGTASRGVLIGVVIPALPVGLAWLIGWIGGSRRASTASWLGSLALALGIAGSITGGWALLGAEEGAFSRLVGAAVDRPRQLPTHDFVVHYLGHALFPWSAVVPFALGRMLAAPAGIEGPAFDGESDLRVTVLLVAAVGVLVYGVMAPTTGHLPFGAVFALAAAVGLAMRDFERGSPGSRTLAMGVAALAILLFADFQNLPEKAFSAFGVPDASFPESFRDPGTSLLKKGTLAFLFVFFFAVMERQGDAGRVFDGREYAEWPRRLRTTYGGNLLFGILVLEVVLVVVAALGLASDRHFHWKQFESLWPPFRQAAKYAWLALPGALVVPTLITAVRDGFRLFFGRVRVSRAAVGAASVATFGLVLSLGYYPALAAQLSPKEVFESYKDLAGEGEPLAMLGESSGSASYYAGHEVTVFSTARQAFTWLTETAPERRWLVVRAKDLAPLNAMYRKHSSPRRNLPVLDGRSSEILLVSSRLEPGEEGQNPFESWLPDTAPTPTRKVDASFGGQLEAIGWDVTTTDGEVVDAVRPGTRYQFRLYYKVMKPISGSWKTFIHVDGFQRRFNGDHDTLEGKYPFHLWKAGDFIADIHEFTLEPNFTPGTYRVYYGLFSGSRRLEVVRGRHDDNRVIAGTLEVR